MKSSAYKQLQQNQFQWIYSKSDDKVCHQTKVMIFQVMLKGHGGLRNSGSMIVFKYVWLVPNTPGFRHLIVSYSCDNSSSEDTSQCGGEMLSYSS